jgi:hypothetical protein
MIVLLHHNLPNFLDPPKLNQQQRYTGHKESHQAGALQYQFFHMPQHFHVQGCLPSMASLLSLLDIRFTAVEY